ncbi:uncharacterized protein [Ptychodera flava]|uniref:uncharacterized protein n=1 Tax=Ptychodera flava TaxID=63121 RepID=UPI00396A8268
MCFKLVNFHTTHRVNSMGDSRCLIRKMVLVISISVLKGLLVEAQTTSTPAAPGFTVEPSDVTVLLGNTAELSCSVEGEFQLVRWIHWPVSGAYGIVSTDTTIESDYGDGRFSVRTPRSGVDFNLRIENVTESENGVYRCVIGHMVGNTLNNKFSSRATLKVILPTTRPPTTERKSTASTCQYTSSSHKCNGTDPAEGYQASIFDVSIQNIDWTDELLDPTSCEFGKEAASVMDLLHQSFESSQLQGQIQCVNILRFSRLGTLDGLDVVKVFTDLPVPINAGISEADLFAAFQCGLLRTNTTSLRPDNYEQLIDQYCNYEDPTTTPPPVTSTVRRTRRPTTPPPHIVPCQRLAGGKICHRMSVKQTIVNMILLLDGIEWRNELYDRRACYFNNVGVNVSNALHSTFDVDPIKDGIRCYYIMKYDPVAEVSADAATDVVRAHLMFGLSKEVGVNLTESEVHDILTSQLETTGVFRGYGVSVRLQNITVDKTEEPVYTTPAPIREKKDRTTFIAIFVVTGILLVIIGIATARLIVYRMTRIPKKYRQQLQEKRRQRAEARERREEQRDRDEHGNRNGKNRSEELRIQPNQGAANPSFEPGSQGGYGPQHSNQNQQALPAHNAVTGPVANNPSQYLRAPPAAQMNVHPAMQPRSPRRQRAPTGLAQYQSKGDQLRFDKI